MARLTEDRRVSAVAPVADPQQDQPKVGFTADLAEMTECIQRL